LASFSENCFTTPPQLTDPAAAMQLLPMFLLLFTTGLGLAGIAGYLIFGPLSYRQADDRGIEIGSHAFAPSFMRWILSGAFRSTGDPAITGLATPAQILGWCTIIGAVASGLLLLPYAF
jgi:hypothetical protein